MDARELRGLAEQLARSILENKNIEATTFQVAKILSYLESEQKERKELSEKMHELRSALWGDEHQPGAVRHVEGLVNDTRFQLDQIQAQSKRNGKMQGTIFAGVIIGVILELMKLLK